jgi:predicted NAD-dependent protein-ADP-ribosyltransferase YbiA (DUF1768 family)
VNPLYVLSTSVTSARANRAVTATHPHRLVEGNTWHDPFWGDCHCGRCPADGENMLGGVLMELRDTLR